MTNADTSSDGAMHHSVGLNVKRNCTDLLCLILLIIFILLFIVMGIFGVLYGDLRRLTKPTDSEGRLCGVDNGEKGNYLRKSYLLFYNFFICLETGIKTLKYGCPTHQVCVPKCPSSDLVISNTNYKTFISNGYCYNTTVNESFLDVINYDKCPKFTQKSTDVLKRCIPSILISDKTANTIINLYNLNISGEKMVNISKKQGIYTTFQTLVISALADIFNSRYVILIFTGISILIGMSFIVLLQFFVAPITVIILVLVIGAMTSGSFFFLKRYVDLVNAGGEAWPSAITFNLKYYGDFYKLNLMIGCILSVTTLILLLIVIAIFKNLRIAVQLLKETSKAIRFVYGVYFWVVFSTGLHIGITLICITLAGYIQSMGEAQYTKVENMTINNFIITSIKAIPCTPNSSTVIGSACRFVKYGGTKYRNAFFMFDLFMWFWLTQFIEGFSTCVVAGAFSAYYWAFKKSRDIPAYPTIKAIWITIRYHLGSVAFGSLIIAIVKFIRAMIEYVSQNLKKYDNSLVRVLIRALKCCFWCLEKVLNFITENAFIYMIVHGSNFCVSAKRVLSLILSNAFRKAVTNNLANLIVFLFILTSTSITTLLAYLWFVIKLPILDSLARKLELASFQLNYELVPVIVVILIALITNRALFQIYSAGVSAIFICFLEDLDINDGTEEKPYFMSNKLLKIIGKSRGLSK